MRDTPWRRALVPLALSVLVVAASLVARYVAYRVQVADPGTVPIAALRLFDVNSERNVPTVWSAALLLSCSVLAVGLARRDQPSGLASAWTLVALVTVLLALDESLAVHERLGGVGRTVAGDALHFAWVVPGALVALSVGVVLLAALRRQPQRVRRQLGLAALVYLTGALVLETVSGLVLRADGDREAYVAVTAVEEGLEMGGVCLLLGTLLLVRASGTSTTGCSEPERTRLRPSCFASYRAASAASTTASGPASAVAVTTPTETVTRVRSSTLPRSRSASSSASAGPAPRSSTASSSPP